MKRFRILIAISLFSFGVLAHSTLDSKDNEKLPIKEESKAPPVTVLSRKLTLVRDFNDTDVNTGNQTAVSNFTLPGGLINTIQNTNGIQKTIVRNNVQYNFFFWLKPLAKFNKQ